MCSLEERTRKGFEGKERKPLWRPIVNYDIGGGAGVGNYNDPNSRSGAKKKLELFR